MKNKKYFFSTLTIIVLLISCCNTSESNTIETFNFNRIELFNLIHNRQASSIEIDSTGRIIELIKHPEREKVYRYYLTKKELHTLNTYLYLIDEVDEPTEMENSSCVDGVSYNLTIKSNDKTYDLENTICDEKNKADEFVLFILNISKSKKKEILFENYLGHQKMIKQAYRILNLDEVN